MIRLMLHRFPLRILCAAVLLSVDPSVAQPPSLSPPPRAEIVEEEPAAEAPGMTPVPRAIPVEEDTPADPVGEEEPAAVPAIPPPADPPPPPPNPEEEVRTVRAVPGTGASAVPTPEKKPEKPKIAINLNTDPSARPLSLRVPAPRGQIVDRNGEALAVNRIGYFLGVQLPLEDGLKPAAVASAARGPVSWVRQNLTNGWDITAEKIQEHYEKRRWVPLLSASMVPDEVVEKIRNNLPKGVVLRPFYLRTYPRETMASHLLGYMGKSGNMASGEIVTEEYLWPPTVGRYGLEEKFDVPLTGEPGIYNVLYNAAGEKLSEEWIQRPKAGHTVVTSLDARFQNIVEREMKTNNVRGAFVIMDVKTGDIVAMVSNPGYNPNDFVYGIGSLYTRMLTDKTMHSPLLPRAIQGQYPPASTFKIVTALAALESGKVSEHTEFDCPPSMSFGRTVMRNHSKNHEGSMNVVRAIKRSCNPWFWRAAQAAGAANLSAMASRLGFGEKTGICLTSMEVPGNMPTPEFYQRRGSNMAGGVLANVAIGQGEVSATPLQVCQMMAAVARGDAVPRPRLVRHIQDIDGRIVQNFPPSVRSVLTISEDSLKAVRRGMRAVVADGDGTGTRASNDYVAMAGKTGTGEWHDNPKDYVAWFAGFLPANNPEYAYAALYEGDPGDQISGGRVVAPIVGDVFNQIYKLKKDGKEIPEPDPKAEEEDGDEKALASTRPRKVTPPPVAQVVQEPVVVEPPKRGFRGWLQRVRGGNRKPAQVPAPGRP